MENEVVLVTICSFLERNDICKVLTTNKILLNKYVYLFKIYQQSETNNNNYKKIRYLKNVYDHNILHLYTNLITLKFSYIFNEPLTSNMFSSSLQVIDMNMSFDKLIECDILPKSVRSVKITLYYKYIKQLKENYPNIIIDFIQSICCSQFSVHAH